MANIDCLIIVKFLSDDKIAFVIPLKFKLPTL